MLYSANRSTGSVFEVFTAHGHISSVRALSVTGRPLTPAQQCSTNAKNGGHLLFSGGGRASLKCWRVDLSVIDVNSDGCLGDKATCGTMVFIGEYSFHFSNHRRRRKKHDLASLSEIRFMSLTSLNALELTSHSSKDQFIGSCQSLYFVMAACSDGFVRVFAFHEQQKKFLLLAQSHYLRRCVLTVNHVTAFVASKGPLVILFAGDTAGRISCWDVTALLLNYMKDRCNLPCDGADLLTPTVAEERTFLKSNNGSLRDDSVSSIMCDAASETRTSCYAEENLMTVESNKGSIFKDCSTINVVFGNDTDCKKSNVEIPVDGRNTEKTDREAEIQFEEHVLLNDIDHNERDAEAYETSKEYSLKELQSNETFNTMFEEQSGHSCLPLVRVFLDPPNHVFQAHQSGVNAISLIKTQVPRQYLMVSGGDDSALYAAEFSFMVDIGDVIKVAVTREGSRASAHTSSVTGVKALKNGLVISSSVDQRIVLWELFSEEQVSSTSLSFRQRAVEMVDAADVQDLEVWGERDDSVEAAICGVGLQTFRLKACV